jgi:hypothetical protein
MHLNLSYAAVAVLYLDAVQCGNTCAESSISWWLCTTSKWSSKPLASFIMLTL